MQSDTLSFKVTLWISQLSDMILSSDTLFLDNTRLLELIKLLLFNNFNQHWDRIVGKPSTYCKQNITAIKKVFSNAGIKKGKVQKSAHYTIVQSKKEKIYILTLSCNTCINRSYSLTTSTPYTCRATVVH